MAIGSFIFGGNTGQSYDSLQRRRKMADVLAAQIMSKQPKTAAEGIGSVLQGISIGIDRYQTDKGINEATRAADSLFKSIIGGGSSSGGNQSASMGMPGAAAEVAATSPRPPADVSQNGSTFTPFIDTVKSAGLTNPYGLAAVAATGRAESGWSPENAARSWSDPSESGQAGTAGGVMSWRADRLANLQRYAASKGEQGNGSPQTQAEFFMREDPNLIAGLNNAKSAEDAQRMMNNAWKFAGYDRPGGEAGRRQSYANGYVSQFQGGGQQVASLDPSAGMSTAASAIDTIAPPSGAVAPENAAPAFDAGRWGDPIKLSEMPASQADLAGNLQTQANAYAPAMQQQPAAPPLAPPQQIAPSPDVASVPQQQAPQQYAQAAPQVDQRLLQALANPFLDEDKKAVIRMTLQQQMQTQAQAREEQQWRARQDYERQQKQSDPSYALDLDLKRAQVQQAKNPSRPITADERRQWGIPEADTRPYRMTANGPDLIGGGGQTINVGGQIEARKQAAEAMGLKPDDARYMGYVLNGELPKENQQSLTAVDKKAIQDADDMVAANNNALEALAQAEALSGKANSGWFAGARASAGNNLPDWMVPDAISSPESSRATTDMDNAIVGQALSQLKTIFGGNPTEGERSILLELQGSSSMPEPVRRQVFARAKAMAQKRLQFNQDRADDLRGGDYYKPGRTDAKSARSPNVDDLLKKYGGQ